MKSIWRRLFSIFDFSSYITFPGHISPEPFDTDATEKNRVGPDRVREADDCQQWRELMMNRGRRHSRRFVIGDEDDEPTTSANQEEYANVVEENGRNNNWVQEAWKARLKTTLT